VRACSQSSHFYVAVRRYGLAIISPSLRFWSSLSSLVKGDKSHFCFECRIIQVSAISPQLAFKTLWGVKFSSHLACLADIFGTLNHMKSFKWFGEIFSVLLPWATTVSKMDNWLWKPFTLTLQVLILTINTQVTTLSFRKVRFKSIPSAQQIFIRLVDMPNGRVSPYH